MSEECYSNYDSFAWFYNKHWSRDVPNQIFTVIEKLLLRRISAGGHVLDLCCGTGQTAAALLDRGFMVTGVDGSEEMLRVARQNASAVKFICADARYFWSAPVYDGLVSTFDSLNHIMNLEELTQVFRNVHAALAKGGLFLFDMNLEQAFLSRWRDYFTIVEQDNICALSSQYDSDKKIGRFDVATFRLKGKTWRRMDFVILERCYSTNEIKITLKKSGFKDVSIYRAEDLGLADHIGRVFLLARKNSAPFTRGRSKHSEKPVKLWPA